MDRWGRITGTPLILPPPAAKQGAVAGYPRRAAHAARALAFAPATGSEGRSQTAGDAGVAQASVEGLRSPETSVRKVLHAGKWEVASIEGAGAAPATAHGAPGAAGGPPVLTADPEVLHRGGWEASAAEPVKALAALGDSQATRKTSIKAVLKNGSWARTVGMINPTVTGVPMPSRRAGRRWD